MEAQWYTDPDDGTAEASCRAVMSEDGGKTVEAQVGYYLCDGRCDECIVECGDQEFIYDTSRTSIVC